MLWEQCAYLRPDEERREAFDALRRATGLDPRRIVETPLSDLTRIAAIGGIHPGLRARRMRASASMVLRDYEGDLDDALRGNERMAIRVLKRFSMIGQPGAEKILLLTNRFPRLALDSNALRVLTRLGYDTGRGSYGARYRRAQAAAEGELGKDPSQLSAASHLLRQHGQETCKASAPRCEECVVFRWCAYYRLRRRA